MNAEFETFVSASLSDRTDESLVSECVCSENYRCFEELTRRYHARVARYLQANYGFQGDMLDEAVQMTFERVWRKLYQFDTTKSFRPWLFRIAVSQAIDLLRDRKRIANFVSLDAPSSADDERSSWAEEISGDELDPSVAAENSEAASEVRLAMTKLSAKHREVIDKVFFQGLTRQSVADDLDLTVSTVSRRVASALSELKRLLAVRFDVRLGYAPV